MIWGQWPSPLRLYPVLQVRIIRHFRTIRKFEIHSLPFDLNPARLFYDVAKEDLGVRVDGGDN